MAISYTDQVRITKEVCLGMEPSRKDTPEEKKYRKSVKDNYDKAKSQGYTISFPNDWEGGF